MSIKGFLGINRSHTLADVGSSASEPSGTGRGSSKGPTTGPLSGLAGLKSKRTSSPDASTPPGEHHSPKTDIRSTLSSSFLSTMRVTEKGVKAAGKSAYKGTGLAGKAAFRGAKKAGKWLDKQFQSTPSRSRSEQDLSDEERYYGYRSSGSEASEHTTSSRNDYSDLFKPRTEVYRRSTRPMTSEERKAAEDTAAYHGHTVDSYRVAEGRWEKTGRNPTQPTRTVEQSQKRDEEERAAHQAAVDNGYL